MTSGVSKSSSRSFRPWAWLPQLSVMDRYIAKELALPFLFGVGAFSSIGVSIGALFELIRRVSESGLSLAIAAEILALKLPEFVVYSFPMSVLLATLMTYGRLSGDSELIALKGCGVSVYRMVLPAIVLSFLITGATFAFNELIVPAANYRAAVTLERALGNERPAFQDRNILYQEYQSVRQQGEQRDVLSRLFYAREFDGERMQGLTILDFTQEGLEQIISAQSAIWNFSQNTWDFYNGTIYVVSADGSFSNILTFEEQQLQLPRAPLDLAARGRDYGEMNIAQSLEQLEVIKNSGNQGRIRRLKVRIQQKYALPFICVAYGLVGSALGTRPQRSNRATSFAVSIVIIFSYYLLMFISQALAQSGAISPFLGGWLPNIFGITAGGFLLVRAAR